MSRAKLQSNLKQISKGIEARAEALCERTARRIEGKTKENLVAFGAVDTGTLLNSYAVAELDPLHHAIGSPVEYAPLVEGGTSKMAPRPALQNAGEDPDIVADFKKGLTRLT